MNDMTLSRRLRTALFALSALLIPLSQAQRDTTQNFDTRADIRQDRSVEFTETIKVTFTEAQHGLIRIIPVRTEGDKGVRVLHFTLEGVDWTQGQTDFQPVPVKQSGSGDITLKIGDANRTLTGPAIFRIRYLIDGAITDFGPEAPMGAHSELYWNMIPAHWATSIDSATCSVSYPTTTGQMNARIYIGPTGSKNHVDLTTSNNPTGDTAQIQALFKDSNLFARAARPLSAKEGMTVVLALPIGTLAPPPPDTDHGAYIEKSLLPKNSPFSFFPPFVPVAIFAILFSKRFKLRSRKMSVAFEAPAGLSLLEAGALVHGSVTPRDFVANVVSMAQLKMWLLVHNPDNTSFSIEFIPPKVSPTNPNGLLRDFLDRPLLPMDQQLYYSLQPFAPLVSPEDLKGSFGPTFAQLKSDAPIMLAAKQLLHCSRRKSRV